ncbi:MAG: hypothetical protein JO360_11455 [Acidobacteria bacterium]|nr:hypothetical protein [Acidobacteriota bacterium]
MLRRQQTKPGGNAPQVSEKRTPPTDPAREAPPRTRVLTPALPNNAVRTLSSEKFRARFSARVERREVESVLRTLEAARADVQHRTAAAALHQSEQSPLDIVIHDTTGDFVAATGQPWWAAAVTHDNQIELQPLEILRSRGVLNQTLRHEYAHTIIDQLSHGRAPRWLAEGLAAHIAGEGALLAQEKVTEELTVEELERRLSHPASPEEMHKLYAAAYKEVQQLIRTEGEASVWRRLVQE